MKNSWLSYPNLKCVILCAGRGKRLGASAENLPKVLNLVGEFPFLHFVVNYWKQFTNDFIFVVHYKKEEVINYVKKLPVNSICVEQKDLRGIADALTSAEPYVKNNFIVVNGDSICNGKFVFSDKVKQGVTIWEPENPEIIKLNFSVEFDDCGIVTKVVEKPKYLVNKWCGIGYYFFQKRVFDYIRQTLPSKLRNEIEITDVIQNMVLGGEKISVIEYQGNFVNVTFNEDLKIADEIFKPEM